jgi:hypothetical protein
MVICPTVGQGFFLHFERRGVVMRCRAKTREEAEKIHKSMEEDIVVDLHSTRFYFQENQILILHKPNHTDPKYKEPYEG